MFSRLSHTYWQKMVTEDPVGPGLSLDTLKEDEAALLEISFSEAEVFKALSDLNGDKAPDPYGFSMVF